MDSRADGLTETNISANNLLDAGHQRTYEKKLDNSAAIHKNDLKDA